MNRRKFNLSAPFLRYLFPKGVAVVHYRVNDLGDTMFCLEKREIDVSEVESAVLIGRFSTEEVIKNLDTELVLDMWGLEDATTLRDLIEYDLHVYGRINW